MRLQCIPSATFSKCSLNYKKQSNGIEHKKTVSSRGQFIKKSDDNISLPTKNALLQDDDDDDDDIKDMTNFTEYDEISNTNSSTKSSSG